VGAAPGLARAGFLEGSTGLTGGDSSAQISKAAVSVAQGVGIKPREAKAQGSVDSLTSQLLKRTEENRAKNAAAIQRRTLLNSEGARIFPGDGLTVFENGVPAEISMDEYKAYMDSGRIVRGSRDLLPDPAKRDARPVASTASLSDARTLSADEVAPSPAAAAAPAV